MISFNSFLNSKTELWTVGTVSPVSELASLISTNISQQSLPAPAISPSLSQRQFWENTERRYYAFYLLGWTGDNCLSLATSQCTSAQLYCSADYSLERTKWFRNRDLFILYFKSGCLLAWFDVSLFASSACWVSWTLKNFLFILLHWKFSRGNSLRWECEVSMLDVVINKILPRLNIAFRQEWITQSSNQQS